MDIKKVMPNINKHIDKSKPYISPSENAHKGLNVPQIVFDYGSIKTKVKSLPNLYKYMFGSFKEMKKTYKELYKQPRNPSKNIASKDLEGLKALAIELGASDIGFTDVDLSYIFDDKLIIYPNAIVLAMEMAPNIIETAPSKNAEKEIFRTYYELCVMVNRIKDFLNDRGYNAEAGPSLGGEVNYPLLAQKSGIGVIGKHGMLITPKLGPSLRLAVVYTDIANLPIENDNKHLWINDFCETCNQCVKKCPGGAIYKDTIIFEDGSKQCIDYKKCAVPFSKQHGCTVCIKECIFFKSNYDKIEKAFAKK
ncbi:MAG: epoxyqueuosine reductase [Firmicutes bacterium]|nr:epoxyqueuosine reductase [Bacillota bacterium]